MTIYICAFEKLELKNDFKTWDRPSILIVDVSIINIDGTDLDTQFYYILQVVRGCVSLH